eukprot:379377-Prymnesium_polylepis.2
MKREGRSEIPRERWFANGCAARSCEGSGAVAHGEIRASCSRAPRTPATEASATPREDAKSLAASSVSDAIWAISAAGRDAATHVRSCARRHPARG